MGRARTKPLKITNAKFIIAEALGDYSGLPLSQEVLCSISSIYTICIIEGKTVDKENRAESNTEILCCDNSNILALVKAIDVCSVW